MLCVIYSLSFDGFPWHFNDFRDWEQYMDRIPAHERLFTISVRVISLWHLQRGWLLLMRREAV